MVYMACLKPRHVSERRRDPTGRGGTAAAGPATRGGGKDAASRTPAPSGHDAGVLGGMRRSVGASPRGHMPAKAWVL